MSKFLVYAAVAALLVIGANKGITELFLSAGVDPQTMSATIAPAANK